MHKAKRKNIFKVLLSFIIGAVGGFIVFVFFSALRFLTWSDGGDAKFLRRLETTDRILSITAVVGGIVTFILIIYKMNKQKDKKTSLFDNFLK